MMSNMKNQILLGDCLELMKEIPDESIDMILCDLPYGTTACKWDTIIPFDKLWEQYERVIKANGVTVLTASQPFTSALVMSNPKLFKYEWIWKKSKASNFQLAKKNPLKIHESVLIFYKSFPTYNQHTLKSGLFKTGRANKSRNLKHFSTENKDYVANVTGYNKSIIEIANPSGKGHLHPTQKPVALFEYLIKTYTNEGNTVLDNCAGSGTTGIACLNTNRNFILMEKEEKYYELIKKRVYEHNNNPHRTKVGK
jgi:site-specific DNA-methyltransferase (adenine-specific)